MRFKFLILVLTACFYPLANAQNTLSFYLEKAEQNSPLLQKQDNNQQLIRLDLKQFYSIYKSPNINLNSNVIFSPIISQDGNSNKLEWVSSGSSNYIGYDLGATNGGQFQALLSVNQPLFTQRYYAAQQEKSNILQERNVNLAQLTKAELKQAVTHQYILCIQSQKQKENIQQTIQIIEEEIKEMKPLVKAGIYKLIDLKLLELELENSQVEEERLNGLLLQNFNALNIICGVNDSHLYKLEDIDLRLDASSQSSSLFTSQFRLDSLSVKAGQSIFNLQYLPQLDVFGDAGLNATYLPAFNRFGFSLGLSLKWNLFDGHQKQINNDRVLLQLSNIQIDRKYFENQNDIRKKNILSQLNHLDKQLRLIDQQLAEYDKLLELYQIEIKENLISVLELKTLIREITMKQQIKTNTLMTKEILINSYNYWSL